MKHLMICALFLGMTNKLFAAALPSEITDDLMKVSTTTLVMALYPETLYNIKVLQSLRDPAKSDLVASWAGLKMSDDTCVIAASWTDSNLCPNIQSCQIQGTAIGLPNCNFNQSVIHTSLKRLANMRQSKFRLETKCVSSSGRGTATCSRYWVAK